MTDTQFCAIAWFGTVAILVIGGLAVLSVRDWWRARR